MNVRATHRRRFGSNPYVIAADAGFALADTVRFLGKERLGLSCGLVGTGMAFPRRVLEEVPWTVTGLMEGRSRALARVTCGRC